MASDDDERPTNPLVAMDYPLVPTAESEGNDPHVNVTIAEALKGLSLQEREQVYLDQHGVADMSEFDRNPELVALKLETMETHLESIVSDPETLSDPYQLAAKQDPEYVGNPTFRLRFLYAELFDPEKAARHMIRYFNYKRDLFGEEKLTKDIGLDDLTDEERATLEAGYVQMLPSRDTAGRPVVFVLPLPGKFNGSVTFGRILSLLDSPVSSTSRIEKRGIVVVTYHTGTLEPGKRDLRGAYFGTRSMSDLLGRIAAIHNCLHNEQFQVLVNQMTKMSDQMTTAKFKVHCGNHAELMYALMTFGIPHTLIPVTVHGSVKRKNHLAWLERREKLEEYRRTATTGSANVVDLPMNNDILLGRGRPIQEHRGNMTLQHTVDDLLPHYDTLGDHQKKEVSMELVKRVKADNGLFLSLANGVWTEVSDDAARDKVSHLFRNRRRHAKGIARVPISGAAADEAGSQESAKEDVGISKKLRMD